MRPALPALAITAALAAGTTACDKIKSLTDGKASAPASAAASAAPPSEASAAPKAATSVPAGDKEKDKASAAADSGPFEGEMDMRVTTAGDPLPTKIKLAIQGQKTRFDVETGRPGLPAMWGIYDAKDNKVYSVVDATRMVMVIDPTKLPPGTPRAKHDPKDWKVTRTGKKDTVAGQACEIWDLEDKKDKLEMCVVKRAWTFPTQALGGQLGGLELGWNDELAKEKSFPVRTVYFENGKEKTRAETVRMESTKVDAARFELPKDYVRMDLGKGFPGIPNMPGMPKIPGH